MSVLPVGFGSSGGYIIENSVRLRASASAYFSKTFGSVGDRKTWTFHIRCKRGSLGSYQRLLSDSTNSTYLRFDTSDRLEWNYHDGISSNANTSTRKFRDPTAWLDIVLSCDTTQATSTNRWKIEVNGETLSAWDAGPSYTGTLNNAGCSINNNTAHYISGYAGTGEFFDGVVADIHFIGGARLSASDFGETNADGVWVPKPYAGSYSGTNSSHMDHADIAVTSGSNAGLGKDVSGNGNYWNTNNISVTSGVTYDALTDTPTNNFATINALDYNNTYLTLSAANLQQTYAGVTAAAASRGTLGIPTTDKWYWEVYITATGGGSGERIRVGICKDEAISGNTIDNSATHYMQMSNGQKRTGTTDSTYGSSFSATQIMQVLYDADAGSLYFGQNNSFANGTGIFNQLWSGAAAAFTGLSGQFFPAQITYGGADIAINFGQRPFTYTPPTGFKALCTANMPAVAIKKPASAFKVTLATEDNIYADVATAHTGWADYIDILKNRAASESWAWQFSHDSSNEYAISAASVTRQTKRTQSGSNSWVGYSIRIGATWGTAAGSASHTNGADTTVTHSVGLTTRQMIFLFPRAGGSTVKVYHPDLASGKLLDLCSNAAETTDATIKTVTSTSFKIDAAMATGTYDYLVLSELSGFFALGKYIGNGDANGPFVHTGLRPKWLSWKRIDTASSWIVSDTARSVYNQPDHFLALQSTNSELGASSWGTNDIVSNGFKPRNVVANETNVSGGTYVFAALPEHPFGGSNVAPSPAR